MDVMKKSKIPVILFSFLIFVVVFRIGYGMWFARYIDSKYGKVLEKYENYKFYDVEKDCDYYSRSCKEGENSWSCFSPRVYTGKYGNLQLNYSKQAESTDADDGFVQADLLIGFNLYTHFFGGTDDYSMTISYEDDFGARQYAHFELDRHMNLKDSNDLSNIELEVYEKYKPRINEMYEAAFEKWPELKK